MRWKSFKNSGIKTYEPKMRVEIRKEHTLPWLSYFGEKMMNTGGFTSFLASMGLGSIKGFFFAKQKIIDAQMKNAKILDLRKKSK